MIANTVATSSGLTPFRYVHISADEPACNCTSPHGTSPGAEPPATNGAPIVKFPAAVPSLLPLVKYRPSPLSSSHGPCPLHDSSDSRAWLNAAPTLRFCRRWCQKNWLKLTVPPTLK